MIDVTVLFLDGTFSSTAIGPMEVFRHAGELWNILTGKRAAPRFRVTTASVRGRAVECDGPIQIRPAAALTAIRKTELIFIPSTGPSADDVVSATRPLCPGCGVGISAEVAIASVCSGVGVVAAAGLLDGKRATSDT
jgi:transcriptional regulator GlxA family with amidase domain